MAVTDVEASTVAEWLSNGKAVLIDVRESSEHEVESIPFARLYPLSSFDPKKVPKGAEKLVFTCAAGIRSTRAAHIWLKENRGATAYNMKGGVQAWIQKGLPSYRNHYKSSELQKKGYRLAGYLILFFSSLAFLNSWFAIGGILSGILFLFFGAKGYAVLNGLLTKLE